MTRRTIPELDNYTLDAIVRGGGRGSRQALGELSGRALCGNSGAQELVIILDGEIRSGTLALLAEEAKPENKRLNLMGLIRSVFNEKRQVQRVQHYLPPDRDP